MTNDNFKQPNKKSFGDYSIGLPEYHAYFGPWQLLLCQQQSSWGLSSNLELRQDKIKCRNQIGADVWRAACLTYRGKVTSKYKHWRRPAVWWLAVFAVQVAIHTACANIHLACTVPLLASPPSSPLHHPRIHEPPSVIILWTKHCNVV